MKKSILLFALFAIIFKSNAYVVSSSNGYDVNIELNLNSLSIASGCSGGWYNYGISYSYDITFTGNNAPNSMWTLQATSSGQDGSTFISLPNGGGKGSSTSSTLTRSYSDCETATPSSLGFDTIYLKIQGPGISTQTIPLHVSTLPVSLLHFTAKSTGSEVSLTWATASELNNDYFTIEKSEDGINYTPLAKIHGAGTTNTIQHYEAMDAAANKLVYYRLKQTDFDGTYSYSPIEAVRPSMGETSQIKVYPNPNTTGTIKVDAGSEFRNCTITVSSLSGQVVQQFQPVSQISELEVLPRGMYVVELTNNASGEKESLRVIQK